MSQIFHDRRLQAALVIVLFIGAFLLIAWTTGQLKERYIDRYNLLILKIAQAQNIGHLMEMDLEIGQFFEDFYDRNPQKVTEMTCELHRMAERTFDRLRQRSKIATQ